MSSSETPQAPVDVVDNILDNTTRTGSRVIPSNQLVVLPDTELAEDRDTEESLELPRPRMPTSLGQVARSGTQAALQASGFRLAPRVASLTRFFGEIEISLEEADRAVLDGTRPQFHGHIRVIREIVAWMRATTADLGTEVQAITEGFQIIDIEDLCHELPSQIEPSFPGLRVNVAPAGEACECRGRPQELAEALFLACVISAHRISGQGSINLELKSDLDQVEIRILGLGEPVEISLPDETARLREILVGVHAGRIVPDSLGPFGTGLILRLPCAWR